jgi:hypothetical protein
MRYGKETLVEMPEEKKTPIAVQMRNYSKCTASSLRKCQKKQRMRKKKKVIIVQGRIIDVTCEQ